MAKSKNKTLGHIEVADRLHSAALHLLRRLRVKDTASGIGPAQLSALSVLVFGGPRSLGDLAEAEQVKPPTMSRIVTGLERSGLVRRLSTEDKRRLQLEATAQGTKVLQEGRKRRVDALAAATQSMSQTELKKLEEFAGLLQRLVERL